MSSKQKNNYRQLNYKFDGSSNEPRAENFYLNPILGKHFWSFPKFDKHT